MKKIILFLQILLMPIFIFSMQKGSSYRETKREEIISKLEKKTGYSRDKIIEMFKQKISPKKIVQIYNISQKTSYPEDQIIAMLNIGMSTKEIIGLAFKNTKKRKREYYIEPFPGIEGTEKSIEIVHEGGRQFLRLSYFSGVKNFETHFNREVEVLRNLKDCENIIKMIKFYEKDKVIDLEYAQGGDLHNFIMNRSQYKNYNGLEKQKKQIQIIKGILSGLKCMHDNNFIHNDLKPQNIVLTKDLTSKLIDFSFSRQVDENGQFEEKYSIGGTPFYSAPEIFSYFENKGPFIYSKTNDIYSLGLILYFILYGKEHFGDESKEEYIEKVRDGWFPGFDNGQNEFVLGLNDIIRECLNFELENRPTINRVIEDFENLVERLDSIED
jgi:serine/threonine protein kinase